MGTVWKGTIDLGDRKPSRDISIVSSHSSADSLLPSSATLHFLSIVETSRIPLHLVISSQCDATTSSPDLAAWFSGILLSPTSVENQRAWWDTAKPDSTLAVLASIYSNGSRFAVGPRPTEVLFYASRGPDGDIAPYGSSEHNRKGASEHTSELSVYAVILSSEVEYETSEPTPPSSPIQPHDTDTGARFLPPRYQTDAKIIHEPPTRKRKSINDTFDEANERRRKAKRHGGESIAAAAAPNPPPNLPTLKHRRSTSVAGSVPLDTRPHSRSPSVSNSRPPTARPGSEVPAPKRTSTLSRMQSTSSLPPADTTLADRNKETISRVVMAGMRLFGLSQSKPRSSNLTQLSETTKLQDEEYKAVYHQVYKGVCFAFRTHINEKPLQIFSEALREVADRLLGLYCNDPLEGELEGVDNEVTPGGRKAFGSGTGIEKELRVFDQAMASYDRTEQRLCSGWRIRDQIAAAEEKRAVEKRAVDKKDTTWNTAVEKDAEELMAKIRVFDDKYQTEEDLRLPAPRGR